MANMQQLAKLLLVLTTMGALIIGSLFLVIYATILGMVGILNLLLGA